MRGRLRGGVRRDAARSELSQVAGGLESELPEFDKGWEIEAVPLTDQVQGNGRPLVVVMLVAAGFLLLIAVVMHLTGTPPEVRRMAYVFAVPQLFVTASATLAALLPAKGNVGGMSVLAAVTKVVWAVGGILRAATHPGCGSSPRPDSRPSIRDALFRPWGAFCSSVRTDFDTFPTRGSRRDAFPAPISHPLLTTSASKDRCVL